MTLINIIYIVCCVLVVLGIFQTIKSKKLTPLVYSVGLAVIIWVIAAYVLPKIL